MSQLIFNQPSEDKSALEDAGDFTPHFDDRGLITAIVTDAGDGELLMVAHNFSRSRGKLWKKGETSGNLQTVKEIRTDCDQDAIWLKVEVAGHDATCHTGRRSCFYRTITLRDGKPMLDIVDDELHFDPQDVYGK
jgi:phosphoribosyl-AMP cyclohydrolase